MSEQEFENQDHESGSALRAELEKAQTRARELEAQNTQLARENTISKAGLTELDATKLEALTAVHKGDLTPEGLRQTAVTLGFVQEKPEVDQATVDAQKQIEQMRAGADSGATSTKDDEINAARTPAELAAVLAKHNVPVGNVI